MTDYFLLAIKEQAVTMKKGETVEIKTKYGVRTANGRYECKVLFRKRRQIHRHGFSSITDVFRLSVR